MSDKTMIISPAKYVSPTAVGFSNAKGELMIVTSSDPLPVVVASGGVAATPLAGQAAESKVAGPFNPSANAPIHLQLSGNWKGTVTVERSIDGGKTRHGLTAGGMRWASFRGNVNEPIWQEADSAASFWLNIKLVSGKVLYRMA